MRRDILKMFLCPHEGIEIKVMVRTVELDTVHSVSKMQVEVLKSCTLTLFFGLLHLSSL